MPDGYPHIFGKRVFCAEDIGGHGIMWIVYFILLIVCAVVQVCCSVLWVIVHLPYHAVLFVIGYWLHSCKLVQIHKTGNRWYRLLLSAEAFDRHVTAIPPDEEINMAGSNSAVIGELLLESIPQTCLVLLNGYWMRELTIIEYVTISGGALIIVNCLFKFGYWRLWMGVSLRHIPLSGRPDDKHMRESSFKAWYDQCWKDAPVPAENTAQSDAAASTAASTAASVSAAEGQYNNAIELAQVASTDKYRPVSSGKFVESPCLLTHAEWCVHVCNRCLCVVCCVLLVVVICAGELVTGSSSVLSLSECVERLHAHFPLKSTSFKEVLDEVLGMLGDDSLTASCAHETTILPKARKIVSYCGLEEEGLVVVAEVEAQV
jgi:hypothetical protein